MIATEEHLREVELRLTNQGVDLAAVRAQRRYVTAEAHQTLPLILRDGTPDLDRFNEVIGGLIERASDDCSRLVAFGELVALLCAQGKVAAALQLESFWNDLIRRHPLDLFCAYPMHGFADCAGSELFARICDEHTHVVPCEPFTGGELSEDEKRRTIALLQHKAAAYERELSERTKMESQLRAATQALLPLAAIVESSEDAIIVKNLNGIIMSWNAGAERIFGYTSAEAIGRPVTMLFPSDHLDEETGILSRIRKGERVEHYETVRRHKDGSLLDISLTVSPVKNERGEIVGASKIARDITARKRSEEQLKQATEALAKARSDLEYQVRERTASLTEAISQMEEFSYTVSHDLRAPLRAMRVYSSALRDDFGPLFAHEPDASHYVERIAENCARLDKMIADVLTYGRVARGEFQLESVSLDRLVKESIDHFPALNPPLAQVDIEPLGNVWGHEPSLSQVLSNLLGNAVKFSRPGATPTVKVWSERRDGRVRLCIEDNGIGIDPKYQHRLFNIFERIHPDLGYEGAGVGLAIVRKAAERMGGKVGVVSDGVKGSLFWVELPGAAPDA